MEKHTRKKSADGIRIRVEIKKTMAEKKPQVWRFPAPEKEALDEPRPSGEDIVIHTYSAPVMSDLSRAESREPTFSERITRQKHPSRKFALWGMAAGLLAIMGAVVLFSTVLSYATIRVKPKVEVAEIHNVSLVFDTSASQSVPEQKIIPAEHLHFTLTNSQEVAVSTTKYVEERASGIVTISNRYTTAPQGLVARTRFLTPSGVLFRLVNPMVIPGATLEKGTLVPHSINVQLIADAPGEQANISGEVQLKMPGFKGTPKYDGFTVVAQSGFSAGFRGTKKVASDADTQSAQQAATKKVYDDLKQQMQQKILPGLRLVEGLQEIRIVKVETITTGLQKDKLAVQATAEADALVFREDDVVALLKNVLLPQDGTKALIDNSISLTYAVQTLNFERGRADASIQGSMKTKQPLTQAQRDGMAHALTGKKIGSVREFFNSRNDVTLSSLSLFPPWKSTLPSNTGHIEIMEDTVE